MASQQRLNAAPGRLPIASVIDLFSTWSENDCATPSGTSIMADLFAEHISPTLRNFGRSFVFVGCPSTAIMKARQREMVMQTQREANQALAMAEQKHALRSVK